MMTLDEAVELLAGEGWACACSGGPPGSSLCYCQLTVAEAQATRRAAHIAVRQLADLAARRPGPCCDSHNIHCEPPSGLCCGECTEIAHDSFPIRHADGTRCVMEEA